MHKMHPCPYRKVCFVRTYLIQELPRQKESNWEIMLGDENKQTILDKNSSLICDSWWCDGNGILRGNVRGSSFNAITSVRTIST